jgi:hypothetical protein
MITEIKEENTDYKTLYLQLSNDVKRMSRSVIMWEVLNIVLAGILLGMIGVLFDIFRMISNKL